MGLGPLADLSLAEARIAAQECRRLLRDGVDPLSARRERRQAARVEKARGISFRECAERLIASHESSWKNAKHRAQWTSTLETYVFPRIGGLSVAAIDTALVLKCIEPIWSDKTETAARIRMRIEAVLSWASARGYRSTENPARWKGHLDKLLPARRKIAKVKHQPALPYDELPAFAAELRGRKDISANALEFTILTAARTGETIGATWDEFDLAGKVWTIPAERMKAKKAHKVPLCERAIELLRVVPRDGSRWVFIGAKAGAPLSNMAMLQLMKGLRPGFVPHGLRSSFRDWAAERTNYPREVAEAALAHALESKVEAAYRRGDLFEKRRLLMRDGRAIWRNRARAAPWCRYGTVAMPKRSKRAGTVKLDGVDHQYPQSLPDPFHWAFTRRPTERQRQH